VEQDIQEDRVHSMSIRIIGIDPGVAGGLACIRKNGMVWLQNIKGKTDKEICEVLSEWCSVKCVVFIEKVGGFMGGGGKNGKNKAAAHNMFTLGDNCGFLRGIVTTLGKRIEYVRPQVWQKYFGLIKKSKTESTTVKKRRHKNKAEQLFPKHKITLATCDALLIAEYGRRVFKS
jgi:hypothetical protein